MRGHHFTYFLIKIFYAKTILTTISVVRLLSDTNYFFRLNFSVNDPAKIPAGNATIPILENAEITANTFPKALGKVFAVISAFSSIGIVALPAGILAGSFTEKFKRKK